MAQIQIQVHEIYKFHKTHHPFKFDKVRTSSNLEMAIKGKDSTTNKLDTGSASKTLPRSGHQRLCQGYSISSPDFVLVS